VRSAYQGIQGEKLGGIMQRRTKKTQPAHKTESIKKAAVKTNQKREQKNSNPADLVEYLRRCHLCDTVTRRTDRAVDACRSCKKPMAPFFFFSEKAEATFADSEVRPARQLGVHPPILGLTVYW
jgi:hypothetical protein